MRVWRRSKTFEDLRHDERVFQRALEETLISGQLVGRLEEVAARFEAAANRLEGDHDNDVDRAG